MTFVGVCGGRKYSDADRLNAILLEHVKPGDAVVHGGATGADGLADAWAEANGCHVVYVPAMWRNFGKSAGPRRNAVIAALPLAKLIAFPGGSGTADMVSKARAMAIPVIEVEEREPGDGYCQCGERLDKPHEHVGA